jgi:Asp-tRNA(Asn)/Glu-tRNA(Gln) amidotransferase A subunit family amidase
MRAEVYTRFFAGLIAVGNDQMVDFNCTSTQEKFLCPGTGCPWNLEALRTAAQSGGGHG